MINGYFSWYSSDEICIVVLHKNVIAIDSVE
jgi:hypothetical protein